MHSPEAADHLERRLAASLAENALLRLMIDKLKLQLLMRVRSQFGASSERCVQGSLLEPVSGAGPGRAPPAAGASPQARAAAPGRRIDRGLPDHLPRDTEVLRPPTTEAWRDADGQPCGCTACGGRLRLLGNDVSEMLEYIPARLRVKQQVRPKLACTRCQGIFQAPAASRPIPRGIAGPGLLAHVMVAKYADHLPLARQSRIYAREGVKLERATLAGWVEQAHKLVEPLIERLGRYVLAAPKLHADDTPVKVLAPGRGKTKTGRLWVYVRDERSAGDSQAPATWFRYSPDRKGMHPRQHLAGYRGHIQADAYAGWQELFGPGGATEVACWAHARRPWWNLHEMAGRKDGTLAAEALQRIRALYAIEEQVRGRPPDERRRRRQLHAKPLLEDFKNWMIGLQGTVSAKSGIAQAIRYSLARWTALTRYLDDGRLEIDNNGAERSLRGVALGRSNYLFMGSDAGGERAAAMYSLVETAKLHGLDPEAYLREVFARIAEHPINRLDDLLPWKLPIATSQAAQAA